MRLEKACLFKRALFLTLTLSLAAILVWQAPVHAATTVTFGDNTGNTFPGTVEDTTLYEGAANNNYGGRLNFAVGEWSGTTTTTRSVIRFKNIASSIGAGKVITSATMYLYCYAQGNTTAYNHAAYRALLNWVEGTANHAIQTGSSCWNYARYTTLPWNSAGAGTGNDGAGEDDGADRKATPEATTLVTGLGWFSWDLTTAVQNWYNGNWSEYGVVIISSAEGTSTSYKQFQSSEGTNGQRPYLQVTYEDAVSTIKISGTAYDSEGGSALASRTIALRVDGSNADSALTNASGYYEFPAVSGVSPGSTVTVWINGDATYKGTTVTIANNPPSDISGLDIYGSVVIVRSEDPVLQCSGTATYETPISATASSEYSATYPASNAIDGDIGSSWFSTSGSPPEWIYFDLGTKKCISAINVVINSSDVPMNMDIQISDDASSWTTIVSSWGISTGDIWLEKTFTETEGRYIRLYETAYARSYGNCKEFQAKTRGLGVTGTPITNADLADYDKDNDPDIHFTSNAGTLTVDNDHELHVWTATSFSPSGAVTTLSGGAGGDIHIDNDATLTAGGAISCGGSWTGDVGSTFTHNSNAATFTATAIGKTIITNGESFYDLTFNGVGGGWTFQGDADVDNNVSITNGAVTGPSGGTITVGGNWSNSDAFAHNNGTVTFNGTGAQTVTTGSSDWNNITITNTATGGVGVTFTDGFTCTAFTDTTPGSTLYFKANETVTITAIGDLTLTGGSGNLITLRRYGGVDPDQWYIHPSGGSWSVSYVDVKDSYNLHANPINPSNSVDSGNTTNWCAAPGTPSSPDPSDGATGVFIDANLDWADSSHAESYDVYFGTSPSPPLYASGVTSSSYELSTLAYATPYYWKIVAKSTCGQNTEGSVWSFTTEPCPIPGMPTGANPGDSATGVSVDGDLDWADSSKTDSYDVYFGTSPTPGYLGSTTTSSYTLATLNCSTPYYWKIIAKNGCGNSTEGPVWNFTTESIPAPGMPSTPSPSNGATGVSVNADLDWADSSDADSYDVYGGTSPTPGYLGSTTTSSYRLGTLQYQTTYYWKIVAKNGCGDTTEGSVWNYITEPAPVADHYVWWNSTTPTIPYDQGWDFAAHNIQDAINEASPGETVMVRAGTYTENITMKSGVNVVSEGDNTTAAYGDPWGVGPVTTALQRATQSIIDGGGVGPVVSFDETVATPASLDGFTVQNIDSTVTIDMPLVLIRGSSPVIRNNIIRDNLGTAANGGVAIRGRYDAIEILATPTIENNLIHYVNGPGVGNGPYSAATIQDNEIWDCNGSFGPGIGIREDAGPTILNNDIFSNAKAGIGSVTYRFSHLAGYSITVKGNNIYNNVRAGIRLDGNTAQGSMDARVFIGGTTPAEGNQIYSNWVGVYLRDIGEVTVENNDINLNRVGIYLNHGIGNGGLGYIGHVRHNRVYNNSRGLRIACNIDATIYENDIYSNTLGMYSTCNPASLVIQKNNIYGNTNAGMMLYGGPATISENNVYQNGRTGIELRTSSGSYVADIIKNNMYLSGRGGIHTASAGPTLNVRQNKVYNNSDPTYGGGIDVRNASGTVENNLVFANSKGGIRFGNNTTAIKNNTVASNGSGDRGGGIIYTNQTAATILDPPTGDPPVPLTIRNNISVYNRKAGIRACFDNTEGSEERDYNLVYSNNGTGETDCGWPDSLSMSCTNKQFGGCGAHWDFSGGHPVVLNGPNDIIADPLFVYMGKDGYHLQAGSPAKNAGDDGTDMGCYGGAYPINNLIDVDTTTGNTPAGGAYIMFDLGASYTVTDIRLYRGADPATTWDVYIGNNTGGCTEAWGTYVATVSLSSSGWNEIDVTDTSGRYMKLECTSHASIPERNVTEVDYKKSEDSSLYWHTPSIPVSGCGDING